MHLFSLLFVLLWGFSPSWAQTPGGPVIDVAQPFPIDGGARTIGGTPGSSNRNCGGHADRLSQAQGASINLDFASTPLINFVELMACITGRNFILTNDLKGDVKLISHQAVSASTAKVIFESVLETHGYTAVKVGSVWKIIKISDAGNAPLSISEGANISRTDKVITHIIQLENVAVTDITSIVKDLSGKSAKIITYAPTNTMIITDNAANIYRVYEIITKMDVGTPKSERKIVSLNHATASDIEKIIKDLYEIEGKTQNKNSSSSSSSRRKKKKKGKKSSASKGASSTNVGNEGKYIEKVISDERTNSLIIIANAEAMTAVIDLIAELDVDVDPASRAQIHVVYLEHAKAEDISQVLSNLSEGGSNARGNNRNNARGNNRNNARGNNRNNARAKSGGNKPEDGPSGGSSAVAAFDSGVRITSDENTNSLVIIATPDQIQYIKKVIEKLDIRRKQVFVEAVILELASDETMNVGAGAHMGGANDDGSLSILGAQLNGSSLGLSADLLTGMAMGVFGAPVSVDVSDGLGGSTSLSIPAFGIALNALQSNSVVNILSTPNILIIDNEEASIVVGRNIPFPVSTGRDNNNNPIVSFQREDVAITLKVTPQINESNYVTLTVFQEVQEVEEDSQGLDVSQAGFITSKRSADTTVVVQDNQTVVIGGLISATDTEVETKIPLLGDIPLIGRLFRGKRISARKSNLLIFLTPHVISENGDLEEVYQVKVAQRQEFIRRFYGKSRDEKEEELAGLLSYSMNHIDQPSKYRGATGKSSQWSVIGEPTGENEEVITPIIPVPEVNKPKRTEPIENENPPEEGE
jgi:general secretion pathway protein D